jgi:UDP-N-acetylglucosamine 2-epimerase (non-hydrolysing)
VRNILIVFGTRPEAIKMAPIVAKFKESANKFNFKVCVTAQHREMLDQVLEIFDITPDYDLNIMKPGQDLFDLTSNVLLGLKRVLEDFPADLILVHGDTTTSFAAALSGFYTHTRVAHIEAGLRTYDLKSPWPEEGNRQLTGRIADINFAPTVNSRNNLLNEFREESSVVVTGNTVVDALFLVLNNIIKENKQIEIIKRIRNAGYDIENVRKKILITGHRRENFGEGFQNICEAIHDLSKRNPGFDFIYPVHLNPNVRATVFQLLSDASNVYLIEPLEYESFVYFMNESYLILTDSGGIQEEAPSLGKPVFVMRNTTERPEAIEAGTVMLVGTNRREIYSKVQNVIDDEQIYEKMSKAHNPYGDGNASSRIVDYLGNILGVN